MPKTIKKFEFIITMVKKKFKINWVEIKNQLKCSICLDYYTDPIIDSCGHTFCQNCIIKRYKNQNWTLICPVSNKIITNTKKNIIVENLIKNFRFFCEECKINYNLKTGVIHKEICGFLKNKKIDKNFVIDYFKDILDNKYETFEKLVFQQNINNNIACIEINLNE